MHGWCDDDIVTYSTSRLRCLKAKQGRRSETDALKRRGEAEAAPLLPRGDNYASTHMHDYIYYREICFSKTIDC